MGLQFAVSKQWLRLCSFHSLVALAMGSSTSQPEFRFTCDCNDLMTQWSNSLRCHSLEDLGRVFEHHGCAIVQTHVAQAQLDALHDFMMEPKHWRARGEGRFSINSWTMDGHPAYGAMENSVIIQACLGYLADTSLVGWQGPHHKWKFREGYRGGDIVLGGTSSYQNLHSDDSSYPTSSMIRGYSVCVGLACKLIHLGFGPTRLVSWQVLNKLPYPRDDGPEQQYGEEWHLTLKPGEAVIRDCRAAHSGTPNMTDRARPFPQMQVMMPQYIAYEAGDIIPTAL